MSDNAVSLFHSSRSGGGLMMHAESQAQVLGLLAGVLLSGLYCAGETFSLWLQNGAGGGSVRLRRHGATDQSC